jgi:ABC-2 type transport system permease protein
MTATTAPAQHIIGSRDPGFGAQLLSEWTKLRSVRSTWIMTGLAIVLSIGLSALTAFVTGLTVDSWSHDAQAGFDPFRGGMAGLLFSTNLLIALSVVAVTSEYSTGMIRTTIILNPRRVRALAARALLIGAIGIAISSITIPGMFLVNKIILGTYGFETYAFSDTGVARVLVVYVIARGLICTLIPFSIAFLMRGAASAITMSIGLFALPVLLAPLLPVWIRENILPFTPDMVIDSLAGITPIDTSSYLSETAAIIVVAIWLVGSLALAGFVLNRRDV